MNFNGTRRVPCAGRIVLDHSGGRTSLRTGGLGCSARRDMFPPSGGPRALTAEGCARSSARAHKQSTV